LDDRVADLLGRLTLDEKAGLLGNGAKAAERVNLPRYQWWNEALHGVGLSPGVNFLGKVHHATSFPQVQVTSQSFNRTLFKLIAASISTEARALFNLGQAGLTFWTPNINIFRDPRWGRGQAGRGAKD
jgi:beta-glucosidase-like glycosyl hydrolase